MRKAINLLMLLGMFSCASPQLFKSESYNPKQQTKLNVDFEPRVFSGLYHIYINNSSEIPFCLQGEKEDDVYHVEDIHIPRIISSNEHGSTFERCSDIEKYLGMVHNHSSVTSLEECGPSDVDFTRFVSDDKAKLETVVCSLTNRPGQLTFITYFKELVPDSVLNEYRKNG